MSSSSTNSFSSPPMFKGENYDFWAIRMQAFLKGNDVWEVIEHGFQLPFPQENPTVAQMKRNAEYKAGTYRALSFLHSAVANDIFPKIGSCQNAQEVWEALKEEYEGSARDKSVTLLALKREFEPKVAAIEESCDLSRLSIKALTRKLQAHEKRLTMRSDKSVEEAFQAKHKGKYSFASSDWKQEANKVEKGGQIILKKTIGTSKSQVFSIFKKFKVLVEKQSGCQLKTLRSDNGKEYTSKEFDVFCEDHGINHQLTMKYTPQQNGISERKNRTMMGMARSMLFEKNLPKKFWAEAVHTAIYLLNGLPTRAVEGKTPIEAWFGLEPSAYHLKDDQKIIKESTSQLNEDLNVEQSTTTTSRHQNAAETDDDSPPWKVCHMDVKSAFLKKKSMLSNQRGSDVQAMEHSMLVMKKEFDMSNLGEMSHFLGLEIKQCGNGIFLSQQKYAQDMMKKFNMKYSKSISTPLVLNCKMSKNDGSAYVDASWYRSIIGSLLYLSATRPDIMFATSLLSRFMSSPTQLHFAVAKKVLRYVNGTSDYGLWFEKIDSGSLVGYSDSNLAESIDDARSTSGYLFQFGSCVFCWNSCKQEVVAQSTIEAEYISTMEASNHAIWLRKMLSDIGQSQFDPSLIYVDNTSGIAIAQNPMQHKRTKHVHVKYHVRQYIKNKQIQLLHCSSNVQLANILTKSLSKQRFKMLREQLVPNLLSRRSVSV
ncbi:hypothetical protein SLEP1_g13712 [Rubroshorea leprosula]|uniref:Integrase catalytic domain-containing protein n=1 Tax=Rubroshorea leprosula TaxID=152421 RepID=A0AAV5ITA9_9ROSI|nr:hypothetical protein SLEP1_g13712 [Rubroshorea leprosula]